MSRDMVRTCLATSSHLAPSCVSVAAGWLVVAAGVEGEFADEFAGVFGDDADLEFADEHEDAGAGVVVADADVVQAAVVAQGEFAVAVDAVFADAEVVADLDAWPGWDCSWP